MAEFKRFDGQALGSDKIGESSGEKGEKIGEIPIPPQTTPMNKFAPKPNHLRNKLDTTPDPPIFPHKIENYQKPIKFVSDKGNVFEGKGEKKEDEKLVENPQPKPKQVRFRCEYCGKEGHVGEFCYKRKRDERLAKEWANKDMYHPTHGVPEPRMPLPRGEAMVRSIPAWGSQRVADLDRVAGRGKSVRPVRETSQTGSAQRGAGVEFRGRGVGSVGHGAGGRQFESGRGLFAGRSPSHGRYEDERGRRSFESQRRYGPRSSFRGDRASPARREVVRFGRGRSFGGYGRMDVANPSFEQMARHWFDSFCTNPSVESSAHFRPRY